MSGKAPPLELVVVEGPDEGLVFPLVADGPVTIGRGGKGLRLTDQLVGLNHAKIEWKEGAFLLSDNGEVEAGTGVGDVILMGSSRAIDAGAEIKVGSTTIRVRRIRTWLKYVAFLGVVAVGLVLGIGAAQLFDFVRGIYRGAIRSDFVIQWTEPVRQSGGVESSEVAVDPAFLRARGIDLQKLHIWRVTTLDWETVVGLEDADELWLRGPKRDYVVSFNPDGTWRVLGDLPKHCSEAGQGVEVSGSFPPLVCPGVTYEFDVDARKYVITEQEGVVVWVAPPAPPRPENAPTLGLTLRDPTKVEVMRVPVRTVTEYPRLAGFLVSRGVTEPISYLVCEDAVPGVQPQVQTAAGLFPLGHGCLNHVRVKGNAGRVLAIAFTAGGHQALIEDVSTYLSGNADAAFVPPAQAPILAAWKSDPGYMRGGHLLEFRAEELALTPIVPERPRGRSSEPLIPVEDVELPPLALTATMLSEGTIELDPPGCAELKVKVARWNCMITSGCTAGTTFVTVRESGCGAERTVLKAPYAPGTYDAQGSQVPVRVIIDSVERQDRIEALRARVSYQATDGLDDTP